MRLNEKARSGQKWLVIVPFGLITHISAVRIDAEMV